MQITLNGLKVHYKEVGRGQPLLVLHGWGGRSDSWSEVAKLLSARGYRVVVPDLPGFGRTPPPPAGWSLDKYTEFVSAFARELGLGRFVLVGHSFGGRVALRYAVSFPQDIDRLVLVDAAGVKHRGVVQGGLLFGAKAANLLFALPLLGRAKEPLRRLLYRAIGRTDYVEAEGAMRDVMRSVLAEDLTPLLSRVKAPTLICWGEKDEYVPLSDGVLMERNIPNSRLLVLEGVGHSPHLEVPERLAKELAP